MVSGRIDAQGHELEPLDEASLIVPFARRRLFLAKDQILVNSVAPAGMATEKAKSLGILGELAAANPGEQVIVSGGYIYA